MAKRGLHRKIGKNKWQKQMAKTSGKSRTVKGTHMEIMKREISSKCLYKENIYQTAENTSKMPKEGKDNLSNQTSYSKQVGKNIGKEYMTKNPRKLKLTKGN